MKTLKRDGRCHCCHWPMKAGDPFRWAPASRYVPSRKYAGLIRTETVRPAHLEGQCLARVEVIEQAEQHNAILDEMARFAGVSVSFVLTQLRAQGHDYSEPQK